MDSKCNFHLRFNFSHMKIKVYIVLLYKSTLEFIGRFVHINNQLFLIVKHLFQRCCPLKYYVEQKCRKKRIKKLFSIFILNCKL